MLTLKKIVRSMGSGVTLPHHVILSDNNEYVLKFPGNPEGHFVLLFESFINDFASYLGLPVVEKRYVNIDFSSEIEDVEKLDERIKKENGYGFAIFYQKKTVHTSTYKFLELSNNSLDYIKMLIFDFIINNTDRNKGNLLYDYIMKKIIIIDHTHSITGPLFMFVDKETFLNKKFSFDDMHDYSKNLFNDFKGSNLFHNILSIPDNIDKLKMFISKIKETKRQKLKEIILKNKNIWNFDEDDVLFICEFLFERMSRVDEILLLLGINL